MAKKKKRSGTRPATTPTRARAEGDRLKGDRPRPKGEKRGPNPNQLAREARERAKRSRARRRLFLVAAVIAVLLTGVVGYLLVDRQRDARLQAALTGGTCTTDERSDPTGPPGQNHVPSPTYAVNPPAGGDHTVNALEAGVFKADGVEDGPVVHALEHGYVVYWHRADISPDDLRQLEQLQADRDNDVLLVERPTLPVPVAATAWGHRLLCEEVEPDALTRFTDEYVNKGPEPRPE